MVSFIMNGQVASLACLVRTFGTLKSRRFTTALNHLVTTHRALPSVALAAETTTEFPLLFVRYAHVNDAQVTWLRKDFERVGKYNFAGRTFPGFAVVAASIGGSTIASSRAGSIAAYGSTLLCPGVFVIGSQ